MSITAVSSTGTALSSMKTPEAIEGPGPDHDGDADDKQVSSSQSPSISSPAPQGMGAVVNTKA